MAQLPVEQIFQIALQHHQAGRLPQAEILYKQILQQQPNYADALHLLGVIAHQVGRDDVAVDLIGQALALKPNYPEAHNNRGEALRVQGQLDAALAAFRQAIAIKPNFPQAHLNLGVVLSEKGQPDEAIAAFRHTVALNPNMTEAHSNLVYTLHFHPATDALTIAEEHRRWNRQHAEPLKPFIQRHANDRSPDRRLRIGYVSPDFRGHPVGLFLRPLLTHHDKNHVQVFAYAQVPLPDAMTHHLRSHADVWRDIVGLSDMQVCDLIRQDQIDILVDLTMHMAGNRLLVFARKPTPVQVTWLAYPSSTGLTTMDYRLSDPYLDPPGIDESVYSERTIRLPDSFWCYDPLDGTDISTNSLPALESGVVTFGCLNNFLKVNEGILTIWAKVLRQVAGSRLLLLTKQGDQRQRTTEFLARQGVEPGRVEFLDFRPRHQYLELYHRIDLGLDSFPYNGHTTSFDSFWMGVPVVTLVGQTAVSRAGWCQLSNLGLTELAAQTPDQFVRIATEMAHDLPRLSNLRSTLRQRMVASPLMDAPRFARNVEAAYRQMWRQWCGTGG